MKNAVLSIQAGYRGHLGRKRAMCRAHLVSPCSVGWLVLCDSWSVIYKSPLPSSPFYTQSRLDLVLVFTYLFDDPPSSNPVLPCAHRWHLTVVSDIFNELRLSFSGTGAGTSAEKEFTAFMTEGDTCVRCILLVNGYGKICTFIIASHSDGRSCFNRIIRWVTLSTLIPCRATYRGLKCSANTSSQSSPVLMNKPP